VQTHWEAGKYEKISLVFPRPSHKRKKSKAPRVQAKPSRWLHEISLPKRLGHHFWPRLTPLAKNTLPIQC